MSEHYCRECKNGDGDTCTLTGATHTTGIECPSFGQKESEMSEFRVRETDDSCNTWTVANGPDYTCSHYINAAGEPTEGVPIYNAQYEAQAALDLYLKSQEPERPFVGHPEGVLEVNGQPSGVGHLSRLPIRTFDTGATRDTDQGKLDYMAALSPIVLRRYVQYLDKHRLQPDGSYRSFDNWKKGIPEEAYISGKGRHFMDDWLLTEGYTTEDNHGPVELEDAICAQLFNLMGRLHEILKEEFAVVEPPVDLACPKCGVEMFEVQNTGVHICGSHGLPTDRTAPTEGGY